MNIPKDFAASGERISIVLVLHRIVYCVRWKNDLVIVFILEIAWFKEINVNSKLTREDHGDQFYVSTWLGFISQFFNQTPMCDLKVFY